LLVHSSKLRRETARASNAYFESIDLRRFGFRIDPTDRPRERSAEGWAGRLARTWAREYIDELQGVIKAMGVSSCTKVDFSQKQLITLSQCLVWFHNLYYAKSTLCCHFSSVLTDVRLHRSINSRLWPARRRFAENQAGRQNADERSAINRSAHQIDGRLDHFR
jgi:hypothetical protein